MRINFAVLFLVGRSSDSSRRMRREFGTSDASSNGHADSAHPRRWMIIFPLSCPMMSAQWHQRAEMLRRRVLVATGLWPMPEKPRSRTQ